MYLARFWQRGAVPTVWALILLVLAGNTGAQVGAAAKSNHKRQTVAKQPADDSSGLRDGLYRSPTFGFTYKIPFGWVDRTAEMREPDASQDSPRPAKAQVLLGVFERPPEATGETVNSTVVIAAESISSYPGLKTAADYFSPLDEVVIAKGFKIVNEPYEFPVGTRQLARSDFNKELGNLTLQQATLAMLDKGYVVSFTFIAGSQDEVDELLEGLSFSAARNSGSASPSANKK